MAESPVVLFIDTGALTLLEDTKAAGRPTPNASDSFTGTTSSSVFLSALYLLSVFILPTEDGTGEPFPEADALRFALRHD